MTRKVASEDTVRRVWRDNVMYEFTRVYIPAFEHVGVLYPATLEVAARRRDGTRWVDLHRIVWQVTT
jgi:hypothetical protein